MKQIHITVSNWLIQNIENIPPGFEVVVRDYDDEFLPSEELKEDENGDQYVESIWSHIPY